MDTPNHENKNILIELVADIVASYVAHNSVPSNELSGLISNVYSAMATIGRNPQAEMKHQEPAVSVKKSITADYLICLEDGKKFKSLKRHLRTKYDLSPEDPHIVAFWHVLESEFSEEEKSAFLRFVWARPTLPPKG